MKKKQAQDLIKKHEKYYSREEDRLSTAPHLTGKPDDHCIICHAGGRVVGVWTSPTHFEGATAARRKAQEEMGWW